jgi:hypothetical protein
VLARELGGRVSRGSNTITTHWRSKAQDSYHSLTVLSFHFAVAWLIMER